MSFFLSKRFSGIFFVLLLAVVLPTQVLAQSSVDIQKSLTFIHSFQDSSGGLKDNNPFDPSNTNPQELQTSWSIVAYGAAGYDPATVKDPTTGNSLIDYLVTKACGYTAATDIERTILAVRAAGLNAGSFGSCPTPLTTKLEALENPTTGEIGSGNISTIFGILAYISYSHTVNQKTIDYVVDHQLANGGWEFGTGFGADANTTAQALMALKADQIDPADLAYTPTFTNGKNYLKSLQDTTGGIRYDTNPWTTAPDANSDAYTLQMIYSLGESPTDLFWTNNGKTILDDLAGLRQTNGSYFYSTDVGESLPVFTTALIVPALNHQFMPIIGTGLVAFTDFTEPVTPPPAPTPTPEPEPTPTPTVTPAPSPVVTETTTNQTTPATDSTTQTTAEPAKTNEPVETPKPAKKITFAKAPKTEPFTDKSDLGQTQEPTATTLTTPTNTQDTGNVLGVDSTRQDNKPWERYALLAVLGLITGSGVYIASQTLRKP